MKGQIIVRLPEPLIKRVRHFAIDQGVNQTEAVRALLEFALESLDRG